MTSPSHTHSINVFEYQLLGSTEAVRAQIQECEGKHVQQAIFSTYMDTLTQICFTEQKIRSTILWTGTGRGGPNPPQREEANERVVLRRAVPGGVRATMF